MRRGNKIMMRVRNVMLWVKKIKWDRMRSLYFSRYVMLFTTETLTLRFLASILLFSWVLM